MPNVSFTWKTTEGDYPLDNRDNGIYLLSHDGLGMPPLHRMEERGALQHGSTDKGYRLDPRVIMFAIGIAGNDVPTLYAKRKEIVEAFKPSDIIGTLEAKIGSETYHIDGYIVSGLEFVGNDRQYTYQKTAISIKCPDPTWYDPDLIIERFDLGGGSSGFTVPMPVPFLVGASSVSSSFVIEYSGSFIAYPIIRITGPITSLVLTNTTTGDKLDFTGKTIGVGETIIIDTRYGHKSVYDGTGANRIDMLTQDSDLATFGIMPSPEVPGGSNSFALSGTNINPASSVTLEFNNKFLGI